ncbi:sugar nucleotide-binding protein [Vagococcus sp. DIV0080]|uniref:Sugar nucleotide-binding protein n=1 Tax=Candidatus Vagococcus giribetii TaxID=2230876 RepID=A0ABS3HUB3_9ENTE|nr:sugar nucleotide-binding protein [Vagococcus sp. DIV0080]
MLRGASAEFSQNAECPKYSVLDLSKTKETGYIILTWQEALNNFFFSDKMNQNE